MLENAIADFVHSSAQKEVSEEEISGKQLGFEYIDRHHKDFSSVRRFCSCKCLNLVCNRPVICKSNNQRNTIGMLIAFQERLRIPWYMGAKHISREALLPAVIVPSVLALSAINSYLAITMLLLTTTGIAYSLRIVRRTFSRTRFFVSWIFWSVVYMVLLFEFTVPLLELLPEENLILVLLSAMAIFCFVRTLHLAPANHMSQSTAKDELPGITEASSGDEDDYAQDSAQTALLVESEEVENIGSNSLGYQPNICKTCRKYMPPRTEHCVMCGVCIMRRDHHSFWLNCCIGERNHRYYLGGLIFALLALVLGANLTLTAVCHPFLVIRFMSIPLMLPDDCSEVFGDFELGISFVLAGYALLIALYVLIALLRQLYLISRGTTMQEYQRGHYANRKSTWDNWKSFIK